MRAKRKIPIRLIYRPAAALSFFFARARFMVLSSGSRTTTTTTTSATAAAPASPLCCHVSQVLLDVYEVAPDDIPRGEGE